MMENLVPEVEYPPKLQFFNNATLDRFSDLNGYGQYSVEFILVVTELIMIQEATNYPTGTMNVKVFQKFKDQHDDLFSVVGAATFK